MRRADGAGTFVEPTVFAGVADCDRIATDEIFGPVMSVLTFRDEAEVVARANATTFGLAAGVFTRDAQRAAASTEAGDHGTRHTAHSTRRTAHGTRRMAHGTYSTR